MVQPFQHQVVGSDAIVRNPSFALFDDMGLGKSKQAIMAASQLFAAGVITTVLIVCPASVRIVWEDPDEGEIKKHATVTSRVIHYHSRIRTTWVNGYDGLTWLVTNYEYLRAGSGLAELLHQLKFMGRTFLILDESSYVKGRTSDQTAAMVKLRQTCARCVLLNGTPLTRSPEDLWSQFDVLDPSILRQKYQNFYHFRARHAIMGGWRMKQVVKWHDLDDMLDLLKPYVLRREKKDCLDLPPKLFEKREVALTKESWKRYQELKRDALITLDDGDKLLEPNSAVRIMRLQQLTSGIMANSELEEGSVDVSDEKLKWMLEHVREMNATAIIWTRWRRERERLVELLREKTTFDTYQIYGGQSERDRKFAVDALAHPPARPTILVANQQAGGIGLNLTGASHVVYMSNDRKLLIRLQSEDRPHRTGQRNPVTYVDLLATGPDGQKTIDHTVVKALRDLEEMANWTNRRWRKELSDD